MSEYDNIFICGWTVQNVLIVFNIEEFEVSFNALQAPSDNLSVLQSIYPVNFSLHRQSTIRQVHNICSIINKSHPV